MRWPWPTRRSSITTAWTRRRQRNRTRVPKPPSGSTTAERQRSAGPDANAAARTLQQTRPRAAHRCAPAPPDARPVASSKHKAAPMNTLAKPGLDHHKDEDVVGGQALFDDVAGEVLRAEIPVRQNAERGGEQHGCRDVEEGPRHRCRPNGGLAASRRRRGRARAGQGRARSSLPDPALGTWEPLSASPPHRPTRRPASCGGGRSAGPPSLRPGTARRRLPRCLR